RARGVVVYAGEPAEAVLLELEARRRALTGTIAADERELDDARARETEARTEAAASAAALTEAGPTPAIDPVLFRRAHAAATRLGDALRAAEKIAGRLEAPLRGRSAARGDRARAP